DPDSDPANPRWFMVDVQLQRRLARTIALDELRAHAGKELKGMVLLRPGNRLSITPVEEAHWKFILALVWRTRAALRAVREASCAARPSTLHGALACNFDSRVYTRTPD